MKVTQTMSLDASKQRQFASESRKLRRKIKAGQITLKEVRRDQTIKVEKKRGLIYIGHLPHGFYEEEIMKYFAQFGKVTNVKVCRSKKSGNSKGFGYVEFDHPEVAKIAAETMNNYIMFKKRVIAEFVPFEKRPTAIFRGKGTQSTPEKYPKQRRRERYFKCKTRYIDEEAHVSKCKGALTRLQKKLRKLNEYGIDVNIQPVDVPEGLQ